MRPSILGFPKRASHINTSEEDVWGIDPHEGGWREIWEGRKKDIAKGGETRFAIRHPKKYVAMKALSNLFKGASLQEVGEKLAAINQWWSKEGGSWEQGPGGSSAQVYSMTPQSLGIPGGNLGGAGLLQNIASMQMRPTMAGGMIGGYVGADGASLVNAYRGAAGGMVGWLSGVIFYGKTIRSFVCICMDSGVWDCTGSIHTKSLAAYPNPPGGRCKNSIEKGRPCSF